MTILRKRRSKFRRTYSSNIKSPKRSQSTGVFPKFDLFWNQARKHIKGKEQELFKSGSKNFEQNIRKYFEWQDYQVLPVCLSNVIFSEKEVKYHLKYRIKYETAAETNIKHETS